MLEACGKNILVDCGMEQGPDLYENQEIPVASARYRLYSPDACTYRSFRKDSDALQTGISWGNRNNIMPHQICVISCCVTVPIFKSLRRNGGIVKQGEAGGPEYEPLYTMADADGSDQIAGTV